MNKSELYTLLNEQVSKSAIIQHDKEWLIHGKFAMVAPVGADRYDVWIHNPASVSQGLGSRKLGAIIKTIHQVNPEVDIRLLDGEADCELNGDDLLACLDVLGIRRKRTVTQQQRNALKARLGMPTAA